MKSYPVVASPPLPARIRGTLRRLIPSVVCALAFASLAQGADWPQWRGPDRNGISSETNWLQRWPPVEKWRKTIGQGYSAVSISEGRLYTMGWSNNQDWVYCLDALKGTQIWARSYANGSVSYEGTRCTPTVDGTNLYTYSHQGLLSCYNKTSGALLWTNLFNGGLSKMGGWNFASSPLVEGNLIVLNANGRSGTAIDKTTRNVVWTTSGGNPGFASAYPFNWGTQRVVAVLSQSGLYGINPATGTTNWSYAYPYINCADPVVYQDKVFISNAQSYGGDGVMLQLRNGTLTQVWSTVDMDTHIATSVLLGDYLYGFDGDAGGGTFNCLSAVNGAKQWTTNLTSGSLMAAGGKLIVVSDTDKLVVLKASQTSPPNPEGRAPYSIGAGQWWTMPVMADSMIYVRSREGTLIALDVATNRAPKVASAASGPSDPVTDVSAALSVLGSDDNGEANLVYTWSAVAPPAPVTFTPNSNNAAKNSTATFTQAGSYDFEVTIKDAGNLTATSGTGVVVAQSVATITVSPPITNVPVCGTQVFAAAAYDQFAMPMGSPPPFAWGVNGGGTVDSAGVFTAGAAPGGPFTVSASNGAVAGTAQVTIPADWNTNGVPDTWEVAHGMDPQNPTNAVADADGDGMNNAAEFVAGTDPTNTHSTAKLAIEITRDGVVVSYPAMRANGTGYEGLSRAYDLESSVDLIGGQWTPIPGATNIPGTDTTAGYTNAGGEYLRFFRTRIRLEREEDN